MGTEGFRPEEELGMGGGESASSPHLSQPSTPFCSWTPKMLNQTLMRTARTSTTSCTCLCDPPPWCPLETLTP